MGQCIKPHGPPNTPDSTAQENIGELVVGTEINQARERSVLIKTDLFKKKKKESLRGVITVNEQEESCPHLMTNDAPFHTMQENTDICLPFSHFITH